MYFYRETVRLYIPFAILYGLQFLIMMVCAHNDSVSNRHVMVAGYILLILVGVKGLALHYAIGDEFFDQDFCADGQLVSECKDQ